MNEFFQIYILFSGAATLIENQTVATSVEASLAKLKALVFA